MPVDIFSRAALPKYSFCSGRLELLSAKSGIIEDAAASDRDFGWLPKGTLVIMPGISPYRLPFLDAPIQIQFVIGNHFLDGLLGWLDRLHAVGASEWGAAPLLKGDIRPKTAYVTGPAFWRTSLSQTLKKVTGKRPKNKSGQPFTHPAS